MWPADASAANARGSGARRARVGLLALLWVLPAVARPVLVEVRGVDGPLEGAVVQWHPLAAAAPVAPQAAVMDQVGSEFVPHVLLVPVGSRVSFPNSDRTRHQVYSFSPAKRFELPLYVGTPPDPLLFDQAGVVTLGCNIHDWMRGYIVVVDTPYAALTGVDGRAGFELADGDYRLEVWHERASDPAAAGGTVRVQAGMATLVRELQLLPPPPPRGNERLRALQDRLRRQRDE